MKKKMSFENPIIRRSDLVVQELENEILIYDLNNNKAFCLNETSGLVYGFCNGRNSVTEISRLMSKSMKTKISEDFVRLALSNFKKENLLENADETENYFAGLSRREILKKVGITSLVALPFVASLVAPTSANAASLNCSCINPGDCITMTSCPSQVNCNMAGICAP